MRVSSAIASLVFVLVRFAPGASFENLDFESANLPVLPPNQPGGTTVPISDAFPSWLGYYGTTPVSVVNYNQLPLGSARLAILSQRIEGNFTAALIPGFQEETGPFTPVSLVQTGFVPIDAQSIRFTGVAGFPLPSRFTVSLDGQILPWVTVEQNGAVGLFAADVSAFAGQVAELRFTSAPNQDFYLDAISFSPLPVPEPGTWALLAGGLLCLAGFIRKRGCR